MDLPQRSSTLSGGVTAPSGFRAAGVSAGIKANGNLDLALIVSDTPATAAAVFTINRAQAAPVTLSREHLQQSGGTVRAPIGERSIRNGRLINETHLRGALNRP